MSEHLHVQGARVGKSLKLTSNAEGNEGRLMSLLIPLERTDEPKS